MLVPPLTNLNLQEYIGANARDWEHNGVVRRVVWDDSDYIAFLIRGPTPAKQFHVDPGDEIFYQLEGELHFHYFTPEGKRELLVLRPGEFFLLPALVPHSPRRPEGSWTLVVERKRRADEVDGWIWFCEGCGNKLYETIDRSGGPQDMAAGNVRSFIAEANEVLRALERCANCGEPVPLPR